MQPSTTGVSRRAFLLSVGGSALLTACGGGGSSSGSTTASSSASGSTSAAISPTGMKAPLRIDLSQAKLPAGAATVAYAYIVGGLYTNAALTNFACYRLDVSGAVHAISTADNLQAANSFPDPDGVVSSADTQRINATYPSAWADYGIALSVGSPSYIDLGNINPANIPGLGTGNNAFSMRIYISLGIPRLPFSAQAPFTDAGGVYHANPYAGPGFDAGSPGALCLFDWFECSIDSGGILNGNPTYVDQFGMPLVVQAQPGTTAQGQLSISRQQVLANIAGFDQTVYAGLIQAATATTAYPSGTTYLRAISPDHLAGLPGMPGAGAAFATYFDSVINAWSGAGTSISVTDTNSGTYQSQSLTATTVGGVLTGTWVFTQAGSPNLTFNDITSANIWKCGGSLASGGTAQQNIGKQILAAFNRAQLDTAGTVTLSDGSCPTPSTAYYQTTPGNQWAQSFHAWSINGLAYGFAYDDVCNQNPSFNTSGPLTSLSITLGSMF